MWYRMITNIESTIDITCWYCHWIQCSIYWYQITRCIHRLDFRWHCTDEWDRRAKNKSLAMWVTCKPLEKRTIWKMSTPAMVSVTGIIRDFKIPGHRLSPAFSLPRNRPDKRLTIWIGISNNCWEKTIKKLLNSEIRWKRFAAPEEMPVQTLQMMAIPSGLMATICSSSVVQV